MEWNLSELFKNNEDFYKNVNEVKLALLEIEKYKNINIENSSILLEMLNDKWQIKEKSYKLLVYGSLKYYKNIKDEECINMKKIGESINNLADTALKFIDCKIVELGKEKVDNFIKENPNLKIYEFALNNLFRIQKHIVDDETIRLNNEQIINLLALYNNLLRDIKYSLIKIDGKEIQITPSNFNKYIASRDRETRRKTYIAVDEAYKEESIEFADILSSIYRYRKQNIKLENYTSVLEKSLFEENIDNSIIFKLIKIVNENIYLIQKYLKQKATLLGIDAPHLYDLGVPLDKLKTKYTLKEAIDIIKNALKPLGDDYLSVVELMLNGHIDALPDDNKHQSITFSWLDYSFLNFKGSYNDVKNLIHEIGHIVNCYLSKTNQPFIYGDSTVFIGEISSIVNEILLNRYLYDNAKTSEEKVFYLSKEIENYFTSVFKQTMYTELENELYNMEDITSELICNKYSEIVKRYYGNNVVYDELFQYEWARLGHLYRHSYYQFNYATGLLIASTLVKHLLIDKTLTEEKYIEFLSSGCSNYSLELLKIIGIDLNNLKDGFDVLEQDVKKLDKVLDKNGGLYV